MKIILSGYTGHMGREVRECAKRAGVEITGGVDPMAEMPDEICVRSFEECAAEADVIIDFSHHSMTGALLDFAEKRNLPVVLATTGQTEEEKARILEAAKKIPLFLAANYSLGIAVLMDLVKRAVALYPDGEIEIVEQHHDRKLDAPSGTALSLFGAPSLISIGATFIPIPGAMGVTDYMMVDAFRAVIDPERAAALALLSRAISFYSCVILSLIIVIFAYLRRRKNQ